MNKTTIFILLALFGLYSSCSNSKQRNYLKEQNDLLNKYEKLLHQKKEFDHYSDIIPFLEKAMIEFNSSDTIFNKIKIDLASYYVLDYLMLGKDTSFFKAKQLLIEVFNFDKNNQFLINEFKINKNQIDSIRSILPDVDNNAEGEQFLFETLEELSSRINIK